MVSYRMVFIYYVLNEITDIHMFHLNHLRIFGNQFNNIDFILNTDDENNIEFLDNLKNEILNITNLNNINFIINKNDSYLREGDPYYKYFIQRLPEFNENELVFFAHTKGLTGEYDILNVNNTKYWITLMYWENLHNLNYIDKELIENDNICFGAIYNYDKFNNTKYHWQYSGSFQWVNPHRLNKVLSNNNFNYEKYSLTQRRHIAEELLGNFIDIDKLAFLDHNIFCKTYSCFLYENSNLPYFNIKWVAFNFLSIDKLIEFNNFLNENIIFES